MPPHKPIIGIVGGIGSGKSTIARQFASLGCAVIDADALAKEALEEPDVITQLLQWWGPGVVNEAGRINRSAVAKIVFSQPEELLRLENLIHPKVNARRAQLRKIYGNKAEVVAVIEDCPLLFEKNLEGDCDAVVFVQASDQNRRNRVKTSRGWTAEDLGAREKKQIALDIKARRADYVIQNDGSEAQSLTHVRSVLSQILQRHA